MLDDAERADVAEFTDRVTWAVRRRFGPTVSFEHGPALAGSATGCGVDQAHLHIVPVQPEAFQQVVSPLQRWLPTSVHLPHELRPPDVDYLWYEAGGTAASLAFPEQTESQFFRCAVAAAAGRPHAWDYRLYPFLENVRTTQDALAGLLNERPRLYG